MRKVLLASSTNPWLRERATKAAFVRRSVRRFWPGETCRGRARGRAGAEGAGHQHHPDGARREPHPRRRGRRGHAALPGGLRQGRRLGPRRARLGQADAARTRSRPRDVRAEPRSPARARRGSATTSCGSTWSTRRYVDPTLELFRRSRAKSPRIGIALQAYLYRTAKDVESLLPLGAGGSHRQGRLPRAAGHRLARRRATSTRTSTSCACG